MNIVFMGSGTLGLPTLQRLVEAHDVRLVITQPDRPAGRKRRLTPTPIGQWAGDHDLNIIKPDKCNGDDTLAAVAAAAPDVIHVAAYGQYIPTKLLALAQVGEMNHHPSLLPRWRGAAPVNFTLISGDHDCGNSLIRVAREMDTGDILAQRRYPIDPTETAGELHDRLAALAPPLVLGTLDAMAAGRIDPTEQDNDAATYCSKLSRDDAWVDFAEDCHAVRCRINGLNPWPGVTARWSADAGEPNEIKLRRAQALPEVRSDAPPGTMIDNGTINCGRGAVQVLEAQTPGARTMGWSDLTRGHPIPVGATFTCESPDQP